MPRKTGLGKGLEALIPADDEQSHAGEGGILHVPVNQITPNPRQPRRELGEAELRELAESIREHGILQPLIVTRGDEPDHYILIAGERRLRASKLAGLNTVPVIVREVTEIQRLELALIENIQRENLSPLETANAYQQLADEFKLTHEEIAEKVGKNRSTVSNNLRLLKLPDAIQEALEKNQITEGHARALLGLSTPQAQMAAFQAILEKGLNVRQAEELVQKMNGHREPPASKAPVDAQVKQVEENLRDHLGTKVTLHYSPKGGSLVIYYYSDEELDTLVQRITHA